MSRPPWVRSEVLETEAVMEVLEAVEANGSDPFATAFVRGLVPGWEQSIATAAYERLPIGKLHHGVLDDEPVEQPNMDHAGARKAELREKWVVAEFHAALSAETRKQRAARERDRQEQDRVKRVAAARNLKTLAPSATRHFAFLAG